MTSSCHSNEMTPLPILRAAVYLVSGNCFSNRSRELFPLIAASMFLKFKRNRYESYRDIFGRGFYGKKYVINWTILMFGRYM